MKMKDYLYEKARSFRGWTRINAEYLRFEGCCGHDPASFVPVIIADQVLLEAIELSQIKEDDLFYENRPKLLQIPDGCELEVLHGHHQLPATEKCLLGGGTAVRKIWKQR